MFRSSNDDPTSEGLSYTSIFFGLMAIAIIGVSFLPRMIKGVILGYEWGAETVTMPLRLPLVRPIYLNEGEGVQLAYAAHIQSGRLEINAHFSTQLSVLPFQSTKMNITTLRMNENGLSDFKAPKSGYYYFSVNLISIKKLNVACEKPLDGFLNVFLEKNTDCASYKMRYSVIIRDK